MSTTVAAVNAQTFESASLLQSFLDGTPARLLVGRAGTAYPTTTQLALRRDHAAALDAVHAEIDLERDLGELIQRYHLFEVSTRATTRIQFLMRPDLGRELNDAARQALTSHCQVKA